MRNITRLVATLALGALVSACAATDQGPLAAGHPSMATARAALGTGAADIALSICQQIAEAGHPSVDTLTCRGEALAMLGKPAEAAQAYASALALDPHSTEARLGLGRLTLATDPAAAERLFLPLLAANPRDAIALNDIGIAQDLQGRPEEAQAAYGRAIAADPDMRAAAINLAISMALSGHADQALARLPPHAGERGATIRERHDVAAIMAMAGQDGDATALIGRDLKGADLQDALAGFRALPLPAR